MDQDKQFVRLGDHILVEYNRFKIDNVDQTWDKRSIQYVFNFQARQVSTIYELNPYNDDKGLSVTMTTQNFAEIEGKEMIAAAHAKLLEMGGNPGPLELEDEGKRKAGKTPLKLG